MAYLIRGRQPTERGMVLTIWLRSRHEACQKR